MGADLYIPVVMQYRQMQYGESFERAIRMRDSLKPPYNEEYQELVEHYFHKLFSVGYFRDSYNNTNLLWRFDLSYWENNLRLDSKGNLPPSQAARLLAKLRNREPVFEGSLRNIRYESWSEPPDIVERYFRLKYLRLRVFLKLAMKLNETITWSV